MKFHCPECGKYVSNVYSEEYGELQGKDSYNPYFQWHVVGTCKVHGEIELKDHDGDDSCGCWSVDNADVWWGDDTDEADFSAAKLYKSIDKSQQV